MKKLIFLVFTAFAFASCDVTYPTKMTITNVDCTSMDYCECTSVKIGSNIHYYSITFKCDKTYSVGDTVLHNVKK